MSLAERILALPIPAPAILLTVDLQMVSGASIKKQPFFTLHQFNEFRRACADMAMEVEPAKAMQFAGWFSELPSAMSYRLWEQGGHEQQDGDVALYF